MTDKTSASHPSKTVSSSPISPWKAGLLGRCPRCGKGRLFKGFLSLQDRCSNCGLQYDFADSADGPAVFIMLIVGFVVMGLVFFIEVKYSPPFWALALIWLPPAILLPLMLLRPFKATFIALQYQNDAREGEAVHSQSDEAKAPPSPNEPG